MNEIKRAVAVGHICLDVIPNLGHVPRGHFGTLFRPGHLISTGSAEFATGGSVANTGLALHKLGVPTQLVAKIGDDSFGQRILELVDPKLTGCITISHEDTTSYTLIISAPGIDRIFLHFPGANDIFCAADIDCDLVAEADLFHFGYPPIMRLMYEDEGAELLAIFQQAKATGATTSLDMALPDPASPSGQVDWRGILQRTLPYVDLFLPSIEEILYMLRRDLYEAEKQDDIIEVITPSMLVSLSDELLAMGVKMLVIKLGHRGLFLRTAAVSVLEMMGRARPEAPAGWADKMLWAPCFQAEVVGTTGAGDAAIAGFLGGLLRELSPEEALTMAVAVGACNVEAADALSGLQSWGATRERVAQGWTRLPLDLSEYGWQQEPRFSLWKPG